MLAVLTESTAAIRGLLEHVTVIATEMHHNVVIYKAHAGGEEFLIVAAGAGKVNLALGASYAAALYDIDRIIGAGTCAALIGSEAAAGHIAICSRAIQYDVDYTALKYMVGELPEFERRWFIGDRELVGAALASARLQGLRATAGGFGSADRFLASESVAERLHGLCHVEFADNAAAPLGQLAYSLEIPFVFVAGVAHHGHNGAAEAYYHNRGAAEANASAVVYRMLTELTKSA